MVPVIWIVALVAALLFLGRFTPETGMVLFGISAFCMLLAVIVTTWRIRGMIDAGLNPSLRLPAIEAGAMIVFWLLTWLYTVLTFPETAQQPETEG